MPSLNPVRRYQPLDPYHHVADNGPIQDLEDNMELINNVLDITAHDLVDCIGTQGTLANRLNISINADGSLKTSAVDEALHSIEEHSDTDDYVRMTSSERDKLSFITDEATDVKLNLETLSGEVLKDEGTVDFKISDTIAWRVEEDGVYADVLFPLEARHRHYYDLKPAHQDTMTPDYQNYYTTSISTAYASGSLRVYINGVRISKFDSDVDAPPDVSYPHVDGEDVTWTSINYTEDDDNVVDGIVTTGAFFLSDAITSDDRITIDFDVVLD